MGNEQQSASDSTISPKIKNAINNFTKTMNEIESTKEQRSLIFDCKVPLEFGNTFNLNEWINIAKYVLESDKIIANMRQKCVPSLIKEDEFWKKYFYIVTNDNEHNEIAEPSIIEHSALLPTDIKQCNTNQLLSIVESESSNEYKHILKEIIKTNNIDGVYFENMTPKQIKQLMGLTDEWSAPYITEPIIQYFKNCINIPINSLSNNESRHILKIGKTNNDVKTFTINKSYKGPLILTPTHLMKLLSSVLKDIPKQIIEMIVLFSIFDESIIALSFSLNLLNKSEREEIYKYLSKMNEKVKDIRSLPPSKTDWYSDDENSETRYGKVCDIIDPSLFVKCLKGNKYQWIPSTIEIIDDRICKIKIISSINRFKNENKNKKLFEIYETVISSMLPHFEAVTQQNLIKNGKKLQIICKAIQYNMGAGSSYGTEWHYEGINEIEHICAAGIFYTFNELDDCGMLEFSVSTEQIEANSGDMYFGDENNDQKKKVKTGNGKHFGIDTYAGRCIVWNNFELQHRLGFIENDTKNEKKRQAIICMLIDPKYKIKNANRNDFNVILNDAKERRKKVKQLRTGNIARDIPYCGDCGAYGHWHNGPGGFPSEPVPIKIVNIE